MRANSSTAMHTNDDTTTVTFYPISVECAAHTCLCKHQDPPPGLAPRTARGFESYDAMNWPIVKLWGRLDSHQPCAVYVHGCFPYFYAAPLEDDDAARRLFEDQRSRRELCRRVAKSLDDALRGNDSGHDNGTCARVRAVTSALLTPFYGYASEPAHFLRVALYRPGDLDVRRAARLLLEGHLVGLEGRPLKLQPYESHVNHHMRFFADCGARALAPLALRSPTFRHAPPAAAGDGGHRWTAERVRGLGLGSRRERRGAADAVEIDVAYGSVAPAAARSDGRPAATYAVPALRDLFDEEAARLRADGEDEAAVERALKVDACWLSPALSPSPPKPVTLGAAAPAEQAKWNAALEALRAAPPEASGDDRGGGEISASQLDADDERRRSSQCCADADEDERERRERERLTQHERDGDEDEAEYERRMTQHDRDGDEDEADDDDDDDEEAEAPRADEDEDDDAPPGYATYESDDDDDVGEPWSPTSPTSPGDGPRSPTSPPGRGVTLTPSAPPPTAAAVRASLKTEVAARPLFYGDPRDVPRRIKALKSGRVDDAARRATAAPPDADLEHWRRLETRFADRGRRRFWRGRVVLAPVADPPSRARVAATVGAAAPRGPRASEASFLTPVDAVRTPKSTGPGSGARDGATMRVGSRGEPGASLLALEVAAACAPGRERSAAAADAILCACWRYRDHHLAESEDDAIGAIAVGAAPLRGVEVVPTELALLLRLEELTKTLDPDVLLGWDAARESWGYVVARAKALRLAYFDQRLSRDAALPPKRTFFGGEFRGRTLVGGWCAVRGDEQLTSLLNADLPAVLRHVLGEALPAYAAADVASRLARGAAPAERAAAVAHVAATCRACLDVVTALDVLGRNLAIARLFGMPLDDALSRGSQHRVEAVLFPVSKPRRGRNPAAFVDGNGDERPPAGETWYALRSPDGPAVANQPALEVVALNLEPVSAVYTEPVACLDFQSLYPSMVIAHNLCFSTCICKLRGAARPPAAREDDDDDSSTDGDVDDREGQALDRGERKDWRAPGAADVAEGAGITTGRLGVAARWPEALARRGLLAAEAGGARAYVAPNGAVFAPKAHREGVLPRMLREILAARIMTKQALKRARRKREGTLARVLDARQLALKLLANVTYGYTAASFSGRQPCADLADAIVDSGRRTLEAAIHVAGGYGAELPVKYGDTDSIFVECSGRSVEGAREHALRRIKDVVDAGTPPGVELKFEYVFDGCVLVTKKRYVGYAVEDPGGTPHLLVKGLEVKTRDNCDFVRHRLEVCVRELLRHRDLSLVKRRVLETFEGVDTAGLRDLILWRKYKGKGSYRSTTYPLVHVVEDLDRRGNATQPGERVPCVVVRADGRSLKLYQRQRLATHAPALLHDIDRDYYVEKLFLPPLSRFLELAGVDVFAWIGEWRSGARRRGDDARRRALPGGRGTQGRITAFFHSNKCANCGAVVDGDKRAAPDGRALCADCAAGPDAIAYDHFARVHALQRRQASLARVAAAHAGADAGWARRHADAPDCASLDGAVAFERRRVEAALAAAHGAETPLALVSTLDATRKRRRES